MTASGKPVDVSAASSAAFPSHRPLRSRRRHSRRAIPRARACPRSTRPRPRGAGGAVGRRGAGCAPGRCDLADGDARRNPHGGGRGTGVGGMAQVDDIVRKVARAMLGAALVAMIVGSGLAFVAGRWIAKPSVTWPARRSDRRLSLPRWAVVGGCRASGRPAAGRRWPMSSPAGRTVRAIEERAVGVGGAGGVDARGRRNRGSREG